MSRKLLLEIGVRLHLLWRPHGRWPVAILALALAPAMRPPAWAAATFVRGDANADGSIDISDPVLALFRSFGGGPDLPCSDAADANDSGKIDITDAIVVLEYLFREGRSPASPFPNCGTDPTGDDLDCSSFPGCKVNLAPAATFSASASTGIVPLIVEFDASGSSDPDGQIVLYLWDFGDGAAAEGARLTHTYDRSGSFTVVLTVKDDVGESRSSSLKIDVRDPGVPPDPVDVAPPLDGTSITPFGDAVGFLYSGGDPVQTGVAPDAIVPARAAVLRGHVLTRQGDPLSAVTVNVLDHPELGSTATRPDGLFDLVVNGGGVLVIQYERAGYLPAQRQIDVPWQDYQWLPDVVLIPLDPQVTAIDLSLPMQVARGSPVADADGTRQATLLFPQRTTAEKVFPDGSRQPLSALSVRATEYSVGEMGPASMPAELPPTSGYTYAVELSADEALAAGATEVRFSSPLPFYVENFLGFPVGTDVPLGGYDRIRGVWVPAASGKVIKILGVTGGLADLDINGDGFAESGAALAALAITDAERQQLALLYSPGQSLWRVLIPHFSPWDCNWPFGPPGDAEGPDQDPEPDVACNCSATSISSIIDVQNQVLGEALGVIGTPFGLHYRCDRVPGRNSAYRLEIPLTRLAPPALPPLLELIHLQIQVAGQLHTQSFTPVANLRTSFIWDGKDAYGRALQGAQPVTVRVCYQYEGVYQQTSKFGYNGNGNIIGDRARRTVSLCRSWLGEIGAWDARFVGLGGWTLSAHHTYDPARQEVHRGDGVRQNNKALGPIITTFAGGVFGGSLGCDAFGDGGPATRAEVCPRGLATAPDGSLYIADLAHRIRRVSPDGIITTVAGNGLVCSPSNFAACGDGGPATQARLNADSVTVGPDGSLYLGDISLQRVRRVGPDGIITTVAGNGNSCPAPTLPCGDGGPATLATVIPVSLAVGPDGSLYIADGNTRKVRRVGPDGIIATVAGNGGACFPTTGPCGDGGRATLATLFTPDSLAVSPDGTLYIGDSSLNRVRRVSPKGIITTVAGTGAQGFSGDGGPAIQATFRGVGEIALGRDESLYIFDAFNHRVRWLRPDGTINTLAGNGTNSNSGDGGPAAQAGLAQPDQAAGGALAVGPDGSVYVGAVGSSGLTPSVRRISLGTAGTSPDEFLVPSTDGGEVYLFDPAGRHLRTLESLTGAVRYQFAYDAAGRLASVTDADGNVTAVERDAQGGPTAIVGPYGQRTTLSVNAEGFLERVTSPAGEAVQVAYTPDGLLTGFTSPRGHTSTYGYDGFGRLTSATDPTNATKTLARTGTNKDYTVTLTSPLGRASTYRVETLSTGAQRLTTINPAGGQTQLVIGKDGRQTASHPDGSTVNLVLGPDPRWRMQAPIAASLTVTTTGGLARTTTTQRVATLTTPDDLLSLRSLTETTTINGTRTYRTTYDGPSRTLALTSPEGRPGSAVLDARGRVVQSQLGNLAPTTFAYDARGRIETVTQGTGPGAHVTRHAYGMDGLLASVTDPLSRTTSLAKDAAGRVVAMALHDGRQAGFAYDSDGNVVERTPPGRPDHSFAFTERDELSAYTPPDVGGPGGETRYTYDADRRLARVDRPDGQAVGFGYDAAGRLDLLDIASGDRTYAYDAAGRMATLGAPEVALDFAYDGRLLTGATSGGAAAGSVTRAYDNNFRVTALGVNGAPVALQYDRDNLRTRAGDLTLTRSAQTGLVTATTLLSVTDTTSYDGFGAAAGYTASHGGAVIFSQAYTRDALGRLTSKSETVGGATRVYSYTYDLTGPLAEVRVDGTPAASYTYDANGNRATFTGPGGTLAATYDAQDRLLLYGATVYTHSANGEISNKTDTATGASTAYRYDTLGNLTGATLPDGRQAEYLLDGRGRRVGKKVGDTLVQGFLYQDGLRPIAELDGAGNVVSRFVYAGGDSAPDYLVRNGVTYRVIADHIGSVRLVLDAATGEVAQRTDYDEFGIVTNETLALGFQPVPFGFAGGLYDRDTGLVHFGAREYDPGTGRWTRKDPIGFGGGALNLYAYAGNDPVNYIDPSGLVAGKTPFPPDSVEAAIAAEGAALGSELAGAGIIGSEAAAGGAAAAGGEAAACALAETAASEAAVGGGILGSAEASLAAQYEALVAGELTIAESEALLAAELELSIEVAVARELASPGHIRMLFKLLSKIVK